MYFKEMVHAKNEVLEKYVHIKSQQLKQHYIIMSNSTVIEWKTNK